MSDCDEDHLGLTDGQHAALTGFTSRAVRALAHLREAWAVADANNAEAVEAAIRALLRGHSMWEQRGVCVAVLRASLDDQQAAELLQAVGLSPIGPRRHS